jgi:serine/threonine protein kinase/WD40 repeat protein
MTDRSTRALPDEEIFAHLVAELEGAADAQAVVADYCRRYPHLSAALRAKAALMDVLGSMRATETDDLPAQLGEFRVIRRVTSGGMGEVFEAEQTSLGRRVAVKTIRRDRISPLAQARFMREQTVLASLHQTHIVSIHTAGSEGSLVYFAMPFIQGATLRQLIDSVQAWQTAAPGGKTPDLAKMAAQITTVHDQMDATTVELPTERIPTPAKEKMTVASSRGPSQNTGRSRTRRLSLDYFRSAAQVMLDAAEALQHAHDLQVLHRDMKPSNLMVDTSGQCWIIDFGLAAHFDANDSAHAIRIPLDGGVETVTGNAVLGTPAYMAPEQWDNAKVDMRADVWGLGATFYELLTLRRPFPGSSRQELESSIRSARPLRLRAVIGNVPEDLAAICMKALEKKPDHRYPTAQALADDLRRWLNREPPSVRRSVPRRLRLWSARNKGWATAIVLAIAALGGTILATVSQADAANQRGIEDQRRAAEEQRRAAAEAIQRIVKDEHHSSKDISWRNDALREAEKAAGIRTNIAKLRGDTADALTGIDGRMVREFKDFSATSVAIDAAGKHVLSGGGQSTRRRNGARLWDLATDQHRDLSEIADGPVAFRAQDGAPLQLTASADQPLRLGLWNMATDKRDREFKLPDESKSVVAALALTSDATHVAAAIRSGGKDNVLFVWDAKTGELIRRVERAGPNVTALAIDPMGAQLAAGFADGQLVVWPLPGGEPQVLPRADQAAVQALAFGRSPTQGGSPREKDGLLAVGADGGSVTIWNLRRGIPQAYCHGSWYGVFTVAFSPDGMTLASAGRGPISLWDTATGRRLVTFDSADFITGLAFTADGLHLAASSVDVFGGEGGVRVWDLEMGRGITTLRGLSAPVANVSIAVSVNRVAALSHNWQIGIWNLKTGFLERILDSPHGITADNSVLEFSPDGRRLFCSTGSEARLWDLTTGAEQKWTLSRGLLDTAAFDADGKKLFLYRAEADAAGQVGRMRDLLGPQPEKPLWENRYFNNRTLDAVVSRDAALVAVHGWHGGRDREEVCKLFRVATGEEVWSLSTLNQQESVNVRLDPSGKFMVVNTGRAGPCDVLELPSYRLIDRMGRFPNCLSPGAVYGGAQGDPGGFALFRRGDETPVVTMGANIKLTSMQMQFSVDGKLLAWGNLDGSARVADIEEVRRQLANYGLNW